VRVSGVDRAETSIGGWKRIEGTKRGTQKRDTFFTYSSSLLSSEFRRAPCRRAFQDRENLKSLQIKLHCILTFPLRGNSV